MIDVRENKYFSKYKKSVIDAPNLAEVQINSFNWFLKNVKSDFDVSEL